MSNYITDLSQLTSSSSTTKDIKSTNTKAGSNSLDMPDFLKLIVAQFQNQDPENAASTTDMMNMLVQMSVVQGITTVTDATSMLYTSSLVGKDVTIGEYDKSGKLKEIVGTVTASGNFNGEPVVFVNGSRYKASSIMAVGKLPESTTTNTNNTSNP
jgi:flagellar basal-body rod modification protein FlgD